MLDRCYLTESVPVQLVWGEQDAVIPVSHAQMAHAAMPGSRLEIFPDSGHYPFHHHPDRFVELVERFIDTTPRAQHDQELLRELLRRAGPTVRSPVRRTPAFWSLAPWRATSAARPRFPVEFA